MCKEKIAEVGNKIGDRKSIIMIVEGNRIGVATLAGIRCCRLKSSRDVRQLWAS